VRAGELRHAVQIQKPVETQNTYNEAEKTWVTLATVYAAIEPMSGREYLQSLLATAEVTVRIPRAAIYLFHPETGARL